jgi:hypothetical protein
VKFSALPSAAAGIQTLLEEVFSQKTQIAEVKKREIKKKGITAG